MSKLAVVTLEDPCQHRTVSFRHLPPTERGVVEQAARGSGEEARAALEKLLRWYRGPVYADYRSYFRLPPPDAEDLTQDFCAQVLTANPFSGLDWGKGQFRWWLRTMARNFAHNQLDKKRRKKRGGHFKHESIEDRLNSGLQLCDPRADDHFDDSFDLAFALATRAAVLDQMERELPPEKAKLLPRLRQFLHQRHERPDYQALVLETSKSVSNLKNALSLMRSHFEGLFEQMTAQTYALMLDGKEKFDARAVEQEVKDLLDLLSRTGL